MKTKYIEICTDLLGAIELGDVVLSDGEYTIGENATEIEYCPWCGKRLVNWERCSVDNELLEAAKRTSEVVSEGIDRARK